MQPEDTYHFHIYYDARSKLVAETVIKNLCDEFSLTAGGFHDNPVGPHPIGSCQITVGMAQFGMVMDWITKNRQELTVFIHANTGDIMKDHTQHTIWMGRMMELDLQVLRRFIAAKS